MIPTHPDWRAIVLELRKRLGSDGRTTDALAARGCVVNRSTICTYASRRGLPRWDIGAALLNLRAEIQ